MDMEPLIIEQPEQLPQLPRTNSDAWILFIDGSSTANSSGVGLIFKTPEGSVIEKAVRLEFRASNNEAEYEALIVRMLGTQDLIIHCDSQLIANQLFIYVPMFGNHKRKTFIFSAFLFLGAHVSRTQWLFIYVPMSINKGGENLFILNFLGDYSKIL